MTKVKRQGAQHTSQNDVFVVFSAQQNTGQTTAFVEPQLSVHKSMRLNHTIRWLETKLSLQEINGSFVPDRNGSRVFQTGISLNGLSEILWHLEVT